MHCDLTTQMTYHFLKVSFSEHLKKKKGKKKEKNKEAPVVRLEPEILSLALAATPIRAFQNAAWDYIFKRT